MKSFFVQDMTVHLAAMHGIAPQPAVNALLLWTLANNTFVMNERTKDNLKVKTGLATAGTAIPQQLQAAAAPALPTTATNPLPFPPADILPPATATSPSAAVASLMQAKLPQPPQAAVAAAAAASLPVQQAVMAAAAAGKGIPSFLQALLNNNQQPAVDNSLPSSLTAVAQPAPGMASPGATNQQQQGSFTNRMTIENIVAKLTRSHRGPNDKESFQVWPQTRFVPYAFLQ